MSLFVAALYNIALYLPFMAGVFIVRARSDDARHSPRPLATLGLAALVAIPSLLQLALPALLPALQRDRELILRDGQLWRLVTALVVQDGWLAGLIVNLIPLLFLGTVAERLWGSRRLLALFFGTGILSQFVGLVWQPRGAGNSVGNFGIAMGLAVFALARSQALVPRLLGGVAIVAGLLLVLQRDIHGGACLIGIAIATLLIGLPEWHRVGHVGG